MCLIVTFLKREQYSSVLIIQSPFIKLLSDQNLNKIDYISFNSDITTPAFSNIEHWDINLLELDELKFNV